MRSIGVVRRLAKRLWSGRSGNFGMMAAIVAPTLLLAAGYGINVAQISITKSNLLAALDSAVTSTARDLTTGVITEEEAPAVVEAFLIANGLRAYAQEGKLYLDSLVIDRVAGTVRAKASVELDVAFALFGAANHQRVTTESAALYSDKKIEVVMALDVTGSMRGRKLDDLKAAASNAVAQLMNGNRVGNERVRISIVPYAEAVNVGALASRSVFAEWEGGPDLPPPVDDPIWASLPPPKSNNNCATERKLSGNRPDFSDDSPYNLRNHPTPGKRYRALVNRDDRLGSCPSAAVIPLTTDKARLTTAIDRFVANGWTAGGIAVQWSYYMLSPNWRSIIRDAGQGDGPADHDERKIAKYVILMTDGAFNTAFAGVTGRAQDSSAASARSPASAEAVCQRMKQDGIEVFTIGFALPASESSAARNVLRNCASPDTGSTRHFFDTSTGEELNRAFTEIARNIERLALTQ